MRYRQSPVTIKFFFVHMRNYVIISTFSHHSHSMKLFKVKNTLSSLILYLIDWRSLSSSIVFGEVWCCSDWTEVLKKGSKTFRCSNWQVIRIRQASVDSSACFYVIFMHMLENLNVNCKSVWSKLLMMSPRHAKV